MKVLVMGGSRFAGLATVRELQRRGHEVWTFNRGRTAGPAPSGAHHVVGDRDVPEDLAQLSHLDLDAVVDFSAYTTAQTTKLLEHLPPVTRIVHCSTGAVYSPQCPQPWREDGPEGPWALWGDYATEKLGCERVLREAAKAPVISLRFPFVLGPRNYADREEFVLNRLLDEEVVLVPGDGRGRLQHISTEDSAYAFAQALELEGPEPFAAYNLAAPGEFTPLDLVDVCAGVTGHAPRIQLAPVDASVFDKGDLLFPFPNVDYVLDTARATRSGLVRPGAETLEEVVGRSFEALMQDPGRRQWSRYPAERAVLGP